MAITGNMFLVRDGVRMATDDVDLHPRTAVGIDRDTGQLLLLVIDGRQDISRGYTMMELAKLFEQLGAEDALNLDGGGSSIMLGRQLDGSLAVVNSPSDGRPGPVANGLEVTYDAVAGQLSRAQRPPGTSTSATVVIGAKHSGIGLGTSVGGDDQPGVARGDGHVRGRVAADRDHRAVERMPSGTSVSATTVLHLRRQRVRLELRGELLDGACRPPAVRRPRTSRRPPRSRSASATSSKSTSSPAPVSLRGRSDSVGESAPWASRTPSAIGAVRSSPAGPALLVTAGTERGDQQEGEAGS